MPNAERILYADDDETSRLSLSELLRREGYKCVTASDGLQATQMVRDQKFDCIISDIQMLGNTRLEFIEEVARHHPGIPVILVTGYPAVATAAAAFKLPVCAYLIKPLDFSVLLKEIREAMLRRVLVRQLSDTKLKLETWQADLDQLATGIQKAPRITLTTPLNIYLMVTFRNLMDAMLGLKAVLEHSLSLNEAHPRAGAPDHSPLLLLEALRETIEVLEKTKDAFRSRDLGELRKKLTKLLNAERENRRGF